MMPSPFIYFLKSLCDEPDYQTTIDLLWWCWR